MAKQGLISPQLKDSLQLLPIQLAEGSTTPDNSLDAPYFREHTRLWLEAWAKNNGYHLYQDGLEVYTP